MPPIVLNTGATYHGEWLNGAREGQGTQTWRDGSVYIGNLIFRQ